MPHILIIEDDTSFCVMLLNFLEKQGFDVTTAFKASEARNKLKETVFDLVLCDLRLPDGGGLQLLSEIKSHFQDTQVVLMTGYAEVDSAVRAIKKGAYDYISKPFTPDEMLMVINGALKSTEKIAILEEGQKPSEKLKSDSRKIIVKAAVSKKLQEHVQLVAPTTMSVLITGESGTGKEVTAKRIHENSKRRGENFVAVDCGAIPKELATSEFFGHLKGSFTGAVHDKAGHFEAANGGTLFLDEIGNLTYENQIQLLRAIQERKIKRVGSTKEIGLDVRIITATNEDLQTKVGEGEFREDLYHRLNEFSIEMPPLRERDEDFMQFAHHFLDKANEELDKEVSGFSQGVVLAFQNYSWPGNLRELHNVIKRAVLLSPGSQIELSALPKEVCRERIDEVIHKDIFSKTEYEKDRILKALKRTNFNKTKAAELLQITRKTLYNKIENYKLKV